MASFNSCHFIGRLTRDPETRTTPSGKTSATFTLAISEKYNGQESTTFLAFTAWGPQADLAAKYLTKGRQVFIHARATQDTWQDKQTGANRSKTHFTVRDIQLIDPPAAAQQTKQSPPPNSQSSIVNRPSEDEDIPF